MDYQAKLAVPFGVLGIRCDDRALLGVDFLSVRTKEQAPASKLAEAACKQLQRYMQDPDARFDVPLRLEGTNHQLRVWHAMRAIPRGHTRSYGELATQLKSAAQAVGQACGANPIPIIVPCHRVLAKSGLGGFMRHANGSALDIKRWLLEHEGANWPGAAA